MIGPILAGSLWAVFVLIVFRIQLDRNSQRAKIREMNREYNARFYSTK